MNEIYMNESDKFLLLPMIPEDEIMDFFEIPPFTSLSELKIILANIESIDPKSQTSNDRIRILRLRRTVIFIEAIMKKVP